jgi:hypothetical protein
MVGLTMPFFASKMHLFSTIILFPLTHQTKPRRQAAGIGAKAALKA